MCIGSTARSAGSARCMLHRPGPGAERLTPRNNDQLLFDGIPWVGRAQEEHDAFADALRDARRRGALPHRPADRGARESRRPASGRSTRSLDDRAARRHAARSCCAGHLADLDARRSSRWRARWPGVAHDELRGRLAGWSTACWTSDDFVIDPLPNLLFTRDSSRLDRRPGRRSPAWRCRPGAARPR